MADISLQKDINLEQATYFSLKGFTDILSFLLSLPLERQKHSKLPTKLSKRPNFLKVYQRERLRMERNDQTTLLILTKCRKCAIHPQQSKADFAERGCPASSGRWTYRQAPLQQTHAELEFLRKPHLKVFLYRETTAQLWNQNHWFWLPLRQCFEVGLQQSPLAQQHQSHFSQQNK